MLAFLISLLLMNLPSNYIGFSRKYRPMSFAELKGQDALVKVLSHSIINNRLARGYLLTGIRGVGKTTSARIIAKTINCTNPSVSGDEVSACHNCTNCKSFSEQKHPDIIEIDAASRTGVDDIRQIIESSEYRPLLARFKVFIIDEVHMLSKGAFNALLKILEEPPEHVVFIFATTEVQKIPLTVVSRCQRYDLRRLTGEELLKLLIQIADKEKLSYESEALKIITSKSDGSAREAISILDQAANMTFEKGSDKGAITTALVNQMLGLTGVETIITLFEYIVEQRAGEAIGLVGDLYLSSVNLEEFYKSASDFVAYLTKAKALAKYQDPTYEAFDSRVTNIIIKTSFSQLSILWQIISKGLLEIKSSHNQLITAEMLVLKAVYAQTIPPFEQLIEGSRQENPRRG